MYSSPLNSHTHCQVAPADTQGKTWQRVWLCKRTTDRQTDEEKEALGGNSGLAKWRVKCFYDRFVVKQTVVLLLNFSANNPPLRQAAKR